MVHNLRSSLCVDEVGLKSPQPDPAICAFLQTTNTEQETRAFTTTSTKRDLELSGSRHTWCRIDRICPKGRCPLDRIFTSYRPSIIAPSSCLRFAKAERQSLPLQPQLRRHSRCDCQGGRHTLDTVDAIRVGMCSLASRPPVSAT